jgi:hypothetical protein
MRNDRLKEGISVRPIDDCMEIGYEVDRIAARPNREIGGVRLPLHFDTFQLALILAIR